MNIEITEEQNEVLLAALDRRISDMEGSLSEKEYRLIRLRQTDSPYLQRELARRDDLTKRLDVMYALQTTLENNGK
jgi:hypothetical protein